MKNSRSLLLLRTLLLSTSQINICRHCEDKRKRRKIIGGMIGMAILYVMLMAYCIVICIGYGTYGLIDSAPEMCALTVSLAAFLFTLFKTNGYLFNFREYDMLMALPFETYTVAAAKFLYMYVKSLPWYLSISLAMMGGYGYFARPAVPVYLIWILLSFFLPVIPMLAAAFIGFLIARVSAGFRKTNMIQTVLTMLLLIFCFSLRFIIEGLFRNNKVQMTLEKASGITGTTAGIYLPARWFTDAVTGCSVPGILLLTGVSAALFAAVFAIVGRSYRNINSSLKSHAAAKRFRMKTQKKRSILQAIAFKEFRRMTGSTVYMTNAAFGEILAALLGIVTLFAGFDRIVAIVTGGAPVDPSILRPAIPFFIYFFIGMVATTACSPSLEGKNYWIVQSLPISKKTLYQGKMLFNLYLTVPFMVFSTICFCVSARVPVIDTVLYLILGVVLCAFSTAWGCVCGVKHMRLDWENEVEVIKQGTAVPLYMFPNMLAAMGMAVAVVFLGMHIGHRPTAVLCILAVLLPAVLSYLRVMALARK